MQYHLQRVNRLSGHEGPLCEGCANLGWYPPQDNTKKGPSSLLGNWLVIRVSELLESLGSSKGLGHPRVNT